MPSSSRRPQTITARITVEIELRLDPKATTWVVAFCSSSFGRDARRLGACP
jgi:hypothetical protein